MSQPLSWNLVNNYTSNSNATEDLLGYSTSATATTENIYLQGFSTAGVANTSAILAATIADGTWYSVSYNSGNKSFYYDYYTSTGASGAGLYSETFDPTAGALGSPTAYLLTPGFTSVSGDAGITLSDGTHLRFVEGFQNSQQVIQDFVGNGSPSPVKTFDLGSATPDHYAVASVTDPNDNQTDYTVLAYTDNNQVHLELLNNYGDQIGSDFIAPGITSFDKLHTIFDTASNAYRVELDYTVADPNGGTEVEGLIYDTSPTGAYDTLSGGGEWNGTPFDDTFIDGPGYYTVNGGGGQDDFQVNQSSDEVALSFSSHHQLDVLTYDSTVASLSDLTGITTLIGFTNINLNDQSIVQSTAAGGYTQLNVQDGSTFGGTVSGFAPGDAVAFAGVTYAPGDHAVFTSNGSGGGTVAIDNSGGTEVASFNVEGAYPSSQFSVSGGTRERSRCGFSVAARHPLAQRVHWRCRAMELEWLGGLHLRRLSRRKHQLADGRDRRLHSEQRTRHPLAQRVHWRCRAMELEWLGGLHLRGAERRQHELAGCRNRRLQRQRRRRHPVAQRVHRRRRALELERESLWGLHLRQPARCQHQLAGRGNRKFHWEWR